MMLDSIDNGPLVYPTVEENRQTRPMKYSELTKAQQLQDDCDVQATNIILHGLPPNQREDPIECINKAMAFLSVVASRFPLSNNQLRTSSNPRNQATIQDGIATTSKGNSAASQPRVVKCYNCQEEAHMEAGQMLEEEQLVFLADPGISKAPVAHKSFKLCLDVLSEVPYFGSYLNDMINQDLQEMQYSEQTHVDNFQDNEIHSDSNIISYSQYLQESQDVVIQDTNPSTPNDLLVPFLVEQMTDHVAHLDKENQINKMVNEPLIAELERYKERVAIFKQRLNENDTLKQTLSNNVKEKESLSKTLTIFKTESKEKESKYIDKEIVLEKQNKELENIICKMYRSTQAMHMLMKPYVFYEDTHKKAIGYQNPFHLEKAQRIQPTLYDGSVIAKEHAMILMTDDEELLILEEESRSKILDKQNDPIPLEKKIKISLIDYSKLNKIKEDLGKHFLTKKELSIEQAFWLKYSSLSKTPVKSHTHVRIEA
ncbi:hypothetical protein Tco_1035319 [Tanacetum coccineum]